MTIPSLIERVDSVLSRYYPPRLLLELQQDTSLELYPCPYEEYFGVESARQSEQCHSLATVTDLETGGTSCVKHQGKVEG